MKYLPLILLTTLSLYAMEKTEQQDSTESFDETFIERLNLENWDQYMSHSGDSTLELPVEGEFSELNFRMSRTKLLTASHTEQKQTFEELKKQGLLVKKTVRRRSHSVETHPIKTQWSSATKSSSGSASPVKRPLRKQRSQSSLSLGSTRRQDESSPATKKIGVTLLQKIKPKPSSATSSPKIGIRRNDSGSLTPESPLPSTNSKAAKVLGLSSSSPTQIQKQEPSVSKEKSDESSDSIVFLPRPTRSISVEASSDAIETDEFSTVQSLTDNPALTALRKVLQAQDLDPDKIEVILGNFSQELSSKEPNELSEVTKTTSQIRQLAEQTNQSDLKSRISQSKSLRTSLEEFEDE